jgi:Uma2 family endonuclease
MSTTSVFAKSCYKLGAPIPLPELLALPPDGLRYTRDKKGRLALMSPDNAKEHGKPLVWLTRWINRTLADPWWVLHERATAFPKTYDRRGKLVRESFLGPKAIEPDIAIYDREPELIYGPHGLPFFSPVGIRLVIEIVSPKTWRSDLGVPGKKQDVDRPRTYLESGVPECWILNAGVEKAEAHLPRGSGRFLERAADGNTWRHLHVVDGRIRSRAIPELALDLEAFFAVARP